MNKIDVKVTPVFNGQELKIFETKCGRYSLFNFYYDPDTECWCFFPTPGSQNRTIFEDKFPMDYFVNLCRAHYFIWTGSDIYPDAIRVVEGCRYLGVRATDVLTSK